MALDLMIEVLKSEWAMRLRGPLMQIEAGQCQHWRESDSWRKRLRIGAKPIIEVNSSSVRELPGSELLRYSRGRRNYLLIVEFSSLMYY